MFCSTLCVFINAVSKHCAEDAQGKDVIYWFSVETRRKTGFNSDITAAVKKNKQTYLTKLSP